MNEMQESESLKFDYEQLDNNTADILKHKENSMREIVGSAYTKLGQELKEAQEVLAKNGYGCFEEWYTALGLDKMRVYRWINRYDLIVTNCDNQNLLEELPVSLTYEMSKKSADPELNQKVLDGDVTTHKQYKELEKAKKQAEERAKELEHATKLQKEMLDRKEEQISELKNREPEKIEVTKEVIPESIKQQIAELSSRLEAVEQERDNAKLQLDSHKEDLAELERLRNAGMDLNEYTSRKLEVTKQINKAQAELAEWVSKTREIQESHDAKDRLNSQRGQLLSNIKKATEGFKKQKAFIEQGLDELDDIGELLETTLVSEVKIMQDIIHLFERKLNKNNNGIVEAVEYESID